MCVGGGGGGGGGRGQDGDLILQGTFVKMPNLRTPCFV